MFSLPFDMLGLVARRRRAEETVRSSGGGARLRLGVSVGSIAIDSVTDGEVRLMSSMPPVLEGDWLETKGEGIGVFESRKTLPCFGVWT